MNLRGPGLRPANRLYRRIGYPRVGYSRSRGYAPLGAGNREPGIHPASNRKRAGIPPDGLDTQ